jgi:3-keto-L-gulonate-6-phosphate decarboxylase
MKRPKIQVALDTTDLSDALTVALQVADVVDRIEIGTPLLRKYGIRAIEALRAELGQTVLVADCKIVDYGEVETTLAINAGANGITVQATAARETVEAVCETAISMGAFAMADSIGIIDMRDLERKLRGLKLSHVIIHRGKDEQSLRGPISIRETIDSVTNIKLPPLAIAGGITPGDISDLAMLDGIDTLIVGEAIISSYVPRVTANKFWSALHEIGDEYGTRRDRTLGTVRHTDNLQCT